MTTPEVSHENDSHSAPIRDRRFCPCRSRAPADAAAAQTSQSGQWQYWASIYAYLPTISGTTSFPARAPGVGWFRRLERLGYLRLRRQDHREPQVHLHGLVRRPQRTLGTCSPTSSISTLAEASRRRGISPSATSAIPASTTANLKLDLKGWVWTVSGRVPRRVRPAVHDGPARRARATSTSTQTLNWSEFSGDLGPLATSRPRRQRSRSATASGTASSASRAASRFGADRRWSVPYYLDIGTGPIRADLASGRRPRLRFKWGEVIAMWRYLDYGFKSDKHVQDINFNGPMIGAAFRW